MSEPTRNSALEAREKRELGREGTRPGPIFRPDVDILERRDDYAVYADLPGVDEKSVEVRLENGVLAIDAQLAALPESGWTPIHREYRLGSYHREFQLSEDVDVENVSAKMSNGVLELRLPKSAARRPRQIAIQTG